MEIFRFLDEDGDGKVYFTEFLAAAMHDQARLHADVVRRTFDHFDAEGTGFMNLDNVNLLPSSDTIYFLHGWPHGAWVSYMAKFVE